MAHCCSCPCIPSEKSEQTPIRIKQLNIHLNRTINRITNKELNKRKKTDPRYEILNVADSFVLDEETLGKSLFMKFKKELNETESHTPITNCVKYLRKEAPHATKELLEGGETTHYRHGQEVNNKDLYYAIDKNPNRKHKDKRKVLGVGSWGKAQRAVILSEENQTVVHVAVKSVKDSDEKYKKKEIETSQLRIPGAIPTHHIVNGKESKTAEKKTKVLFIQSLGTQNMRKWQISGFDETEIGLAFKTVLECNKAGFTDRDLKEENIAFMQDAQGNKVAKLIDLETIVTNDKIGQILDRVGSPITVSPEMVSRKPFSAKEDVYALGNILFRHLYKKCNQGIPRYYNELISNGNNNHDITNYLMNKNVAYLKEIQDIHNNLKHNHKNNITPSVPITINNKDIKILLNGLCKMLSANPDNRPTMEELEQDHTDFWDLVTDKTKLKKIGAL
jgi:hypothetical protein